MVVLFFAPWLWRKTAKPENSKLKSYKCCYDKCINKETLFKTVQTQPVRHKTAPLGKALLVVAQRQLVGASSRSVLTWLNRRNSSNWRRLKIWINIPTIFTKGGIHGTMNFENRQMCAVDSLLPFISIGRLLVWTCTLFDVKAEWITKNYLLMALMFLIFFHLFRAPGNPWSWLTGTDNSKLINLTRLWCEHS